MPQFMSKYTHLPSEREFATEHLDKDQDFWNNVLWTDESKFELFGHSNRRHVWHKLNTTSEHKKLIPTVKV